MGNVALLKERAKEEFERVKNLRKNTDRDYLVMLLFTPVILLTIHIQNRFVLLGYRYYRKCY